MRKTVSESTFIFLHIPKTAGSTMYNIIDRQYRPEHVFTIGPLAQEGIERLKSLSEACRAELHVLKGHMPFGLHGLIPGPSTYFTFLREPVDRVISCFYFIYQTPGHYLYDFFTSKQLSLIEYLQSRNNIMFNNAQTRLLSGVWYDLGFGECTEEVLEAAKRNLRERFAVVGLTERFDETLLLLKKTFGWWNLFYAQRNVTANRPKKADLSPATLEAILEVNQLDVALYQYAQRLFDEQIERYGSSFARDLETFRRLNRLLSPAISLYWTSRKWSLRAFLRKWSLRVFLRRLFLRSTG